VVPIKVIHKVTFSFTPYPLCFHPPYPLFPQSKEILLNLTVRNAAETQHLMHKVREYLE